MVTDSAPRRFRRASKTALTAFGFRGRGFEDFPEIDAKRLGDAKENIERRFAQLALDQGDHADVKTRFLGEHVH